MRVVWLGCSLALSGCFLTGYELHPLDEPDAAEAPEAGGSPSEDAAALIHGSDEAGVGPQRDAAIVRDAKVDPNIDAALDGGQPSDGGSALDAERDASDHAASDASSRDDASSSSPDAGGSTDADAGADAEVDASAPSPDAEVTFDAGTTDASTDARTGDASASDAGADACGPYGCVVQQGCVGKSCDLACNEAPDPGITPTLDCQFDCANSTHCAASCSSYNTCQTNCTSARCDSTCPYYAECSTSCTGSTCSGTCAAYSDCTFNCTTSTCSNIVCALGASCRVHCLAGSGTCGFAYCGSLIVLSCPDGSIVCGQTC